MRSEQEMLSLIVETAERDDRVRSVIMNGSRANPAAHRDIFQDFDIVYLVTDVDSFRNDQTWIDSFGERIILQMPEAMQSPPPEDDGRFSYLMQFSDGNRIDLTLFPVTQADELRDSLSVLLIDKDGIIKPFAAPNDNDYLPTRPTAKEFSDCCNEFWWVCPYVAKGLWREEVVYAKYMLDGTVRKQLIKMITWYVGTKTDFSRNAGAYGKWLKQYLEPELWNKLLKTYSDAGYETTWDALIAMCDLFRGLAIQVAEDFGFEYPQADDDRVSAHLLHARQLPKDAREIY